MDPDGGYQVTFGPGPLGLALGQAGRWVTVRQINAPSSADASGAKNRLKTGDRVISVAGTVVVDWSLEEVSAAIRGAPRPLVIAFNPVS